MKILITGASGFVGRHVVKALKSYDHELIATSRSLNTGMQSFEKLSQLEFDFSEFDPKKNYFEIFGRPDLLIHLTWQGLPNYKSLFHFEDNLPVQYAFLKNMIENGLKDITVTGTCFEYGIKEGMLSEDMCADPQNPYALAKDTLRKFIEQLQLIRDFDFKWLRLFYMYGEGQNPNSLLSQLQKAIDNGDESFNMSGGEQLRDYLPVETVAQYIVEIALQNKVTGIINCCNGRPVKVIDLVENYLSRQNRKIKLNKGFYPYPDYEAMAFWGDDRKLKTIIS